jgi:hypothetical protein
MEQQHAASVSGRLVAEFQDDARQPLAAAEPVPSAPTDTGGMSAGSLAPRAVPTQEAAALAKTAWLRVIRRFTEPVPGEQSRVRVQAEGEAGRVSVECRGGPEGQPSWRTFSGSELDVGDDFFLTIFLQEESRASQQHGVASEHSFTIPWTEIACLHFERSRRVEPDRQ